MSTWSRYDSTVMLSPAPSMIGPMGYAATISAPARYSGNGGPGTLEMTRLWMGRCESARFMEL